MAVFRRKMNSITPAEQNNTLRSVRLWSAAFWLVVWEIASLCIGQELLLVTPVSVVIRLLEMIRTTDFWYSVAFSFARIVSGFLLAVVFGTVLAGLAARFRRVQELLVPAVLAIKATPVASFIILVLIWVPSRNLSILISFLMVLPVIYTNVLGALRSTDPQLLEMARLFRIPAVRTIRYIYVSQVLPFFRSACSVSLGLCWKSGVAAEVIGIPSGSIGEKLYQAKIYLNTPDLFAWTLVIIIISLMFEKLFLLFIDRAVCCLERM